MPYVHLKYSVLIFMIIGLWPLKIKNRSLSIALRGCLDGWSVFLVVTLTVALFLEIPHVYHIDINIVVSNIMIGGQFVLNIIKCWTFRLPAMKHLIQRMLVTEQNILKGKNEEIKAMMMKHVKMLHKIVFIYVCATCGNIVLFGFIPFILTYFNSKSELEFPLYCWLPFDKNEHYFTAYMWMFLGGVFICVYSNAGNLTYFGLIIFLVEQLEILKHEIRTGIDNTKYNHMEVHQNLRKICSYYKNIRRFVTNLNSIMKFLLLLEFILRIAHVAMVGFSIITDKMSIQLVKNIWYLFSTLIGEVVLFYWLGNEIFVQNCGVTDAIWESDWYNCNLSNKKTILILMMQTQQDLKIDIGYSRTLSLETLLMMLKTSASYMITLKQFIAMKTDA